MPNTILLKGDLKNYDEALLSVAAKPGYLLERDSDGKMKPASVRGGRYPVAVAWEDGLIGGTIENVNGGFDTMYEIGDRVRFNFASPGNIYQVRLHAGENVAIGDPLINYGDGSVCKAASAFLANQVAAGTALTNSTTETALSTLTIPKNTLKVGDVIRFRAQAIATATNSTDTLNAKIVLGSDTVAATGALDVADNGIAYIEGSIVIRTIGASGTYVATGVTMIGVEGTATAKPFKLASTAIDTTADIVLKFTGTWSVASASNSVRSDVYTVEHVKAGSSVSNGDDGGFVVGFAESAKNNSAGETDAWVKMRVAS